MALIQCENNHFYDDSKDSFCPYCAKLNSISPQQAGFEEQLTSYYAMPLEYDDDDSQKTQAYDEDVEDFQKTIGIFMDETENILTTGWLVCMNGKMKGKSYVIHSGRNFAGRSFDMDIALTDDLEITREAHFSIVFEPKSVTYFIVPGAGRSYLNGKIITEACELNENDEIQAGQSKYIFVPFCKEGRIWD